MAKGRNLRGPYSRPSNSSSSVSSCQASCGRRRVLASMQPRAKAASGPGSRPPVSSVMQDVASQMSVSGPAGPVRGTDRDEQPPPHPRGVARIDAAGKRGPDPGQAAEAVQLLDQVAVALGARARVKHPPGPGEPGEVGAEPALAVPRDPGRRLGLAVDQVVVRRIPGDLQQT